MKKWKAFLLRLPVYLVLVTIVGFGLWKFYREVGLPQQVQEILPTDPPLDEQGIPPEELVDNIIGIGDIFSLYPWEAVGHFDCKITSARFVTQQEDCPREWLIDEKCLTTFDEEHGPYYYDEWFLPGGPLEQGARLVRIDLEVTNVDAVANVHEGGFNPSEYLGAYREQDLFDCYNLLVMTDLSTIDSYGNSDWYHAALLSETGKIFLEDDWETPGDERYALKIAPGETKQITIIFSIPSTFSQTSRNPEYLFVLNFQIADRTSNKFTYIDLNLEETA